MWDEIYVMFVQVYHRVVLQGRTLRFEPHRAFIAYRAYYDLTADITG